MDSLTCSWKNVACSTPVFSTVQTVRSEISKEQKLTIGRDRALAALMEGT
jgi:hypothetical protein